MEQSAKVVHRRLPFDLVEQITNSFSDERLLGSGSYGSVYKGEHEKGETIAVKLFRETTTFDGEQFDKEYLNLTSLQHKNIVRVVAYCYETRRECAQYNGRTVLADNTKRAVCFEYMLNGSLAKHLSDECSGHDWQTRYQIIKGICEGMKYLHEDSGPAMWHLDLKPENILLDQNLVPKIGDFGTSRLVGEANTQHTQSGKGTIGYQPPEYIDAGLISIKFDIYSLGVVIIKILTGPSGYYRMAEMSSQDFIELVHAKWRLILQEKSIDTLEAYSQQVKRCTELALSCVDENRHKRPCMGVIMNKLIETENMIQILGESKEETGSSMYEKFSITNGATSSSITTINSTTETGKLSSGSSAFMSSSAGSGGMNRGFDEGGFLQGQILEAPNLRTFRFLELRTATKNFRPDSVLGEGGFGRVYKGWVDEKTMDPAKSGTGMVVAVKKLNSVSLQRLQGYEECQSERSFLGRLSHPNLVKLLGYCWEVKELFLVYEFMAQGSLENHLFRRGYAPLTWELRLKIAIGAARGLAFLHTSEKQIMYREFKASNIILDANYNAKLSDFGLAKLGPTGSNSHITTRFMAKLSDFGLAKLGPTGSNSHITTRVIYGCAAPEYVATGHLYVKSDVYGFGVVMLEMLSGQRALAPNRPNGQINLVDWAKPYLADRRKLARLMDPRFEGQYNSKQAHQLAQLTLNCLAGNSNSRPSMKEVLETLEQIEAMKSSRDRAHGRSAVHQDDRVEAATGATVPGPPTAMPQRRGDPS